MVSCENAVMNIVKCGLI